MNEAQYKELLRLVKLMLTFNITLYSLDEFSHSKFYVKADKQIINRAKDVVEKHANPMIAAMFNADEATVQTKLKEYEEIAEMLAKATFDDLSAIYDGLVKYFKEKNDNNS